MFSGGCKPPEGLLRLSLLFSWAPKCNGYSEPASPIYYFPLFCSPVHQNQGFDGASIMTPASLPLNITASLSGTYQDVYTEADNQVFLLLTTANLYRLDPVNGYAVLQSASVSLNDDNRTHFKAARSLGWVYVNSNGVLRRFSKSNLSN